MCKNVTIKGQYNLSNKIERLSKGQNHWQVLSVVLPEACSDMGSLQIPGSEDILIFGGFN
jgi:hypothetical protein